MPQRDISTTEWLRLKRLSETTSGIEPPTYEPMAKLSVLSQWEQAELFNALADEQLAKQKEEYEKQLATQQEILEIYSKEEIASHAEFVKTYTQFLQDFAQKSVTEGQAIVLEQAKAGEIAGFEKMTAIDPLSNFLNSLTAGIALGGSVLVIFVFIMIALIVVLSFKK